MPSSRSCSSSTCSVSDLIHRLQEKLKTTGDPTVRRAIRLILDTLSQAIARGYLSPSSPSSYLYDLYMIPSYWHAVDLLVSHGYLHPLRLDPRTVVSTLLSF